MFPQTRLKRLRKTPGLRRLVQETTVSASQLIWPCFVVPGRNIQEPIRSMPGQFHYSIDRLAEEVKVLNNTKIGGILLFGVPDKKDAFAKSATDKKSLIVQAIQSIKEVAPDLPVITDVCLCAYTDHGHCGILDSKGNIQNDASCDVLAQMALSHAEAGADMVAPSDMMDGRIQKMRHVLDESGFEELPIMSYAAKYASAFYGPFRDAAHSTPSHGDRKTYQMNPANAREALREMKLDLKEGADILMVKPAGPYLDIIAKAKERFDCPIAAYQVSGEYAMIKAAAANGWLNENEAVQESLLSIKRAGADIIITYFAKDFSSPL
ncbi:MAG: porphobilinogen synthase [Deltaproteobacteria bacterium]|nr:porphobilinogen synthase [Deltaproteobacteria bacterium]